MEIETHVGHSFPATVKDLNMGSYIDWDELSNEGHPEHDLWINLRRVLETADEVISGILSSEENRQSQRNGVFLAIAYRGEKNRSPFLSKIGTINAIDVDYVSKETKYGHYAYNKAKFLLEHPSLIASLQNLNLPKNEKWILDKKVLPGGSLAFKNGLVLAISGLSTGEKDTAAVLSIGVAAHLIRPQVAAKLARSLGFAADYQKFI